MLATFLMLFYLFAEPFRLYWLKCLESYSKEGLNRKYVWSYRWQFHLIQRYPMTDLLRRYWQSRFRFDVTAEPREIINEKSIEMIQLVPDRTCTNVVITVLTFALTPLPFVVVRACITDVDVPQSYKSDLYLFRFEWSGMTWQRAVDWLFSKPHPFFIAV